MFYRKLKLKHRNTNQLFQKCKLVFKNKGFGGTPNVLSHIDDTIFSHFFTAFQNLNYSKQCNFSLFSDQSRGEQI